MASSLKGTSDMKKHLLFPLLLMMAVPADLCCQNFAIGTDALGWLSLGTMNLEATAAVSRNISVNAGGELNPWTFNSGDPDTQMQLRRNSWWAGARWWPWHIYSGWWAGADFRYTVYNAGGIVSRETEEGDAFGGSLMGGYAVMLSQRWNLDFGAGIRGGWTSYTVYACPLCGVKTESGGKVFIIPDARIALQYIF